MTAIGVAIFIFAILFSVGLHEFGHFITAKRFGMKVHSFYIGFKPALWKTQRGETEYGIGAVPFGGFVKIAGMNPYEDVPPEDRDRVFKAKKPWQRAIVLASGSLTHFVLGFVLIAGVLATAGVPDFNSPTLEIGNVSVSSPADVAGFRRGDHVRSVDGQRIAAWTELVEYVRAHPAQQLTLVIERDGEPLTLTATTAGQNDRGEKVGFLGVGPDYARRHYSVPNAISTAATQVGDGIVQSAVALKDVFSPSSIVRMFKIATGQEERQVTDPTTLVGAGGQAGNLFARGDIGLLFLLIAGFNVFVGFANLLPLPPLDGGHLAVLAYEKIRRRDVDMRKLIPVSVMVIAIFGGLFLLLLYLDVVSPVPNLPG